MMDIALLLGPTLLPFFVDFPLEFLLLASELAALVLVRFLKLSESHARLIGALVDFLDHCCAGFLDDYHVAVDYDCDYLDYVDPVGTGAGGKGGV